VQTHTNVYQHEKPHCVTLVSLVLNVMKPRSKRKFLQGIKIPKFITRIFKAERNPYVYRAILYILHAVVRRRLYIIMRSRKWSVFERGLLQFYNLR
jgi:hypothetical protein